MRTKEEILNELKKDDEKSRERPSYESLLLEVLIDIRDAVIGETGPWTGKPPIEETVEAQEKIKATRKAEVKG